VDLPTVVITGATDGQGRGLALALATEPLRLVLHGRDAARGEQLLADCRAVRADVDVSYLRADFASLAEIAKLSDELGALSRLDVLVNNAGIGVELGRRQSEDGYEMAFQVDYLAGYVLSCKLISQVAAVSGRIVNVSSAGQAPIDFDNVMLERNWQGGQSYCQAKLAQIMLTFSLASTAAAGSATVNALHPASYMPTKIVTHLFTPQSTLAEGVENVRSLARDQRWSGVSGQYFNRQSVGTAHNQAYDPGARSALVALSESLTGVAFPS
jgi:NAD(P)-dependent dehydrogenase (short-subunit alcohol dehydrogenase family)